nr:hypothetical protein [Shewanella psychrotolerans]
MNLLSPVNKIQPQWWQKTLIASLLGFSLAYSIIGLFAWFGPGGIDAPTKVQFNMWLVCLLWLCILSLGFMFKTARNALLYLGLANLLSWLIFAVLRWSL